MGPRRSDVGSRNERTPAGSWNLSRLAVVSRWIGGTWYARRNACARLPLHRSYSQLYRSFLMEHRPLRGVPNMVVAAVEVEPIAASIPSSSVWQRSRAMVDSAPKMPSKTHPIGTTRGVTEGTKGLRTHERDDARLSRVGRLDQQMLVRTNVRSRRKETWRGWLGRRF